MTEQVSQQLSPQQNSSKTPLVIVSLIILISVIAGIAILWWDSNRLVVEDQPLDNLLLVNRAVLINTGFIEVYNVNNLGEKGSFLLGRTLFLESGVYEHITVDINPEITDQNGEKILQVGDQVIVSIQKKDIVEENTLFDSGLTARDFMGQELKKNVSLY
jgi:hypothetical protein